MVGHIFTIKRSLGWSRRSWSRLNGRNPFSAHLPWRGSPRPFCRSRTRSPSPCGLSSCSVLSPSLLHGLVLDVVWRSEEHTSELQSRLHLVCRLLLEKKKNPPRPLLTNETLSKPECGNRSDVTIRARYCHTSSRRPP